MKIDLARPWQVAAGDVMAITRSLPANSVHMIVTSPPYYGLRDYGIRPRVWGGKPECKHKWVTEHVQQELRHGVDLAKSKASTRGGAKKAARVGWLKFSRGQCSKCGAWRGVLGLEPTPELYVEHMVEIFRELRRVLRKDGTLWLNLGDSYANDGKWGGMTGGKQAYLDVVNLTRVGRSKRKTGLKPKDLIGMPWRIAFALQADGWWLRQEVIWAKPNPMPESVLDRCTNSHERVFLLTKSARYFFDHEAIKEDSAESTMERRQRNGESMLRGQGQIRDEGIGRANRDGRDMNEIGNSPSRAKRSVWTIATQSMDLEMCGGCGTILNGDGFRCQKKRTNETGRIERQCPSCLEWDKWLSHFATFPEALVEPCILAGTSARGCCAKCGAPVRRVTVASGETKPVSGWNMDEGSHRELEGRYSGHRRQPRDRATRVLDHLKEARNAGGEHDNPFPPKVTTGWEPTCKCESRDTVNPLVLDPFSGAGTTGVVAVRFGRRFLGIDVKKEYCALAEYRIKNDRPLFNDYVEALSSQPSLFFTSEDSIAQPVAQNVS